jgi:four helix bundle protein
VLYYIISMKGNILKEKSYLFSVRIVNLYKFLKDEHKEYIISQQVMRCGTAIGAIIREAEHAESLKDFIHIKYRLKRSK